MSRAAPQGFMLVAGEPSGDLLAAELVAALRGTAAWGRWPHSPRFFGAGGTAMAGAGVDLAFDLTEHAVVGLAEVLRQLQRFRRLMLELIELACARQPDVVIGVDYSGFNRRLIRALRRRLAGSRAGQFHNWRPLFVQYVSPQVWASRPGRAYGMAEDLDLLLCLFPFEKPWYARRVPHLRVEWVGHPLLDRHGGVSPQGAAARPGPGPATVLLLPGSRVGELQAHLPVMLAAADRLRQRQPVRFRVVLPDEDLRATAEELGARDGADLTLQVGGLDSALRTATVAIASTGTVTLECALFGVPTVTMYKTSWTTWQVAKRLVTVRYAAMPNLLADAMVFPEFIQDAATPENLAAAAGELLAEESRREAIRKRLTEVIATLGGPGASQRAAAAIVRLFEERRWT